MDFKTFGECRTMTFLLANYRSTLTAAIAVLLTFNITSFADAGPLAGLSSTPFAFNDGGGQTAGAWQNSEVVQGVAFAGTGFQGTVEYAVFAPGLDFGDFLGDPDPTGGGEWVYAFQSRLDGDNDGVGLESLLAGFDLGAPVNLLGSVAGTGDVGTSSAFYNATSAQWNWTALSAVGLVSDVLYYTSPFSPKRDMVSVKAGFFADAGQSSFDGFASPIPEPGSLLLVVVAAALVVARRSRFLHTGVAT
jgi:hypothetical protein